MMAKAGYTLGLLGFLIYLYWNYIFIGDVKGYPRLALFISAAIWAALMLAWLLLLIWLP